jgi:hypothetical protein
VQGPAAYLTTLTREFGLFIDHCTSFSRDEIKDYDLLVDYEAIFSALRLERKTPQQDGEDEDAAPDVIRPLPWRNAPKPDGSTTEFKERLEQCREFMHCFAMHTPYYFLEWKKGEGKGKGKAVDVDEDEDEDEDEDRDGVRNRGEDEGQCLVWVTASISADSCFNCYMWKQELELSVAGRGSEQLQM